MSFLGYELLPKRDDIDYRFRQFGEFEFRNLADVEYYLDLIHPSHVDHQLARLTIDFFRGVPIKELENYIKSVNQPEKKGVKWMSGRRGSEKRIPIKDFDFPAKGYAIYDYLKRANQKEVIRRDYKVETFSEALRDEYFASFASFYPSYGDYSRDQLLSIFCDVIKSIPNEKSFAERVSQKMQTVLLGNNWYEILATVMQKFYGEGQTPNSYWNNNSIGISTFWTFSKTRNLGISADLTTARQLLVQYYIDKKYLEENSPSLHETVKIRGQFKNGKNGTQTHEIIG